MSIILNHTIVPARDKHAAASYLADLLGLEAREAGHFVAVQINDELTLDFDNSESFDQHHYAFLVGDAEFDQIFARIKEHAISYAADPFHRNVGQINNRKGGRGFYFRDPNDHIYEVMTRA
jgi:catechol 2,3-dioxygenase-like lactoylglutathione lyase family enzyme